MMTSVRLRTRRGVFETRKTNTESKEVIKTKNQFEILLAIVFGVENPTFFGQK